MSELRVEPIAHIFSKQIEKLETTECVVDAFSVAMGRPDDKTVPFYSQSQVDILKKRIKVLEQLQRENNALRANLSAVSDLARFMCDTWTAIDAFVYENFSGDALMKYPVIQGTSNQFNLNKIGGQAFDKENIKSGVEYLLRQQGGENNDE